MYLELTPIEIRLLGLVTLEINLLFTKIKKVLFQRQIWGYKAPTIRAKMVDTLKKEVDKSAPEIDSFVDKVTAERVNCLSYSLFQLL